MQTYDHFCDPEQTSSPRSAKQLVTTKVCFEKVNGKRIFVTTDFVQDSKRLVIFSHGFRGNSCGPARQFVTFARLLNLAGFSTLRFDQPCCGNSEGNFLDVSFLEWVATTQHFAQKYLKQNFEVTLMGQSMGASTSVIVSAQPSLKNKISNLLLWVPDPKSDLEVKADKIYEEDGEKYYGRFWLEMMDCDFFACLGKFKNPIHLVYGDEDRYISSALRLDTIKAVANKGGKVLILADEDHSPWKYKNALTVMKEEIELIS